MNDHTPKDTHYAKLRRKRRDAKDGGNARSRPRAAVVASETNDGLIRLYGLHTVRHALENPRRNCKVLHATPNALERLALEPDLLQRVELKECHPRALDQMVGSDAVHQGCVLEAEPLDTKTLEEIADSQMVLVLDQVTDPHNVGAIMRSCVAMNVGALITTSRHSPTESGVLAKSASGALDMIDHIQVRNLANALGKLHEHGYQTIGLDSEGPDILERSLANGKIALVMGAEGKGLREKTRATCTTLARIDMPGPIRSLNVSNAAAISLYTLHKALSAD